MRRNYLTRNVNYGNTMQPSKLINAANNGALGAIDPATGQVILAPQLGLSWAPVQQNPLNSPINLNITRETNTILLPLPFALWAPVNRSMSYRNVFQSLNVMPAGATVDFSFDNTTGDGLFTWTVGGNTDIIRIHNTGLVPYGVQWDMIFTGGMFYSSGIRYGAMSTNFTAQYTAYNFFTGLSTFEGRKEEGSSRVSAMKGPDQFQDAIIDFSVPLAFDNTRYIVNGFPSDAVNTPNTITWDFFDVTYASSALLVSQ